MAYAVSDRSIQDAPHPGRTLITRPGFVRAPRARVRRQAHTSLAIHWPRVIALGANVLIWVTVITAVMHVLRR